MKVLLTCGHPDSGFALVHDVMLSAGVAPARPSRREQVTATDLQARLLQALGIDPAGDADVPAAPGHLWQELAVDLFLGNMSAEVWGWADAATLPLLDFWREFDNQTLFLLVYSSPAYAVAQALQGQPATADAVDRIVAGWTACNNRLLRFFHRHRERCELVEVASALHAPDRLVERAGERWGLGLLPPAPVTGRRGDSAVAAALAKALVQDHDEAHALFAELESVAGLDSSASEAADDLCAWDEYRAERQDLAAAIADAGALRENAARLQQLNDDLQKALDDRSAWVDPASVQAREARLRTENEVLHTQVHQLQEEVELHFLRDQQRLERDDELAKALEAKDGAAQLLREQLAREQEEKKRLVAEHEKQIGQLGEQLAAWRRAGESAVPQSALDETRKENELLLLQVHQLQEELEHHYLKNRELAERADGEPFLLRFLQRNQPSEVIVDLRDEIDGRNWYHAEDDGRWAGPAASSTLRIPALLPGDYTLEIDVVDAMSPAILEGMEVYLNGARIPTELPAGADYPALVSGRFSTADVPTAPAWQFEFRFKDLISPVQRGESDPRIMAVRIRSLALILDQPASG